MLTALDGIIVVAYLLFIVYVGVLSSRQPKEEGNSEKGDGEGEPDEGCASPEKETTDEYFVRASGL